MSTDVVKKPDRNIPAEYKALFGPPPLYKTEDEKNYNAILCGLEQDVRPQDHFERTFVRDLTDLAYEIQWWRRLRNRLIRQVHKEDLQRQAAEVVLRAKSRKDSLRGGGGFGSFYKSKDVPDPNERDSEAETTVNAEMKKIDADTENALAELRQAEHGPIDEAALFRNWIPLYDLVEKRLTVAEEKLSITLAQLEEHRNGLGPLLRRATETIIDAEPIDDLAPAREALAAPEEPRQPQ
jgi:hypothetical protein